MIALTELDLMSCDKSEQDSCFLDGNLDDLSSPYPNQYTCLKSDESYITGCRQVATTLISSLENMFGSSKVLHCITAASRDDSNKKLRRNVRDSVSSRKGVQSFLESSPIDKAKRKRQPSADDAFMENNPKKTVKMGFHSARFVPRQTYSDTSNELENFHSMPSTPSLLNRKFKKGRSLSGQVQKCRTYSDFSCDKSAATQLDFIPLRSDLVSETCSPAPPFSKDYKSIAISLRNLDFPSIDIGLDIDRNISAVGSFLEANQSTLSSINCLYLASGNSEIKDLFQSYFRFVFDVLCYVVDVSLQEVHSRLGSELSRELFYGNLISCDFAKSITKDFQIFLKKVLGFICDFSESTGFISHFQNKFDMPFFSHISVARKQALALNLLKFLYIHLNVELTAFQDHETRNSQMRIMEIVELNKRVVFQLSFLMIALNSGAPQVDYKPNAVIFWTERVSSIFIQIAIQCLEYIYPFFCQKASKSRDCNSQITHRQTNNQHLSIIGLGCVVELIERIIFFSGIMARIPYYHSNVHIGNLDSQVRAQWILLFDDETKIQQISHSMEESAQRNTQTM